MGEFAERACGPGVHLEVRGKFCGCGKFFGPVGDLVTAQGESCNRHYLWKEPFR